MTTPAPRTTPTPLPEPAAARTAPLAVGVALGNTLPWLSPERRAETLDDVVRLGAGWVRMDVSWDGVQPGGPDSWWWEPYDAAIADAHARGLKVLAILAYTPAWAREPGCTGGQFCPPADPHQFAAYAAAVAERYAPQGVTAYEIWNEPNLPFFWTSPDPQRYRELLLPATAAVHRAAPDARVLFGGLAYQETGDGVHSPSDFLREACLGGGCEALAGVSYHPYTFPHLPSDRTAWRTPWEHVFHDGPDSPSLVTVLDSLGLRHLTVEMTEYGAPTGGGGTAADSPDSWVPGTSDHVTERLQAETVSDGLLAAYRHPRVSGAFVYTHRDSGAPTDPTSHYGLRRADGSAKPAWQAFADAVAEVTAAARP